MSQKSGTLKSYCSSLNEEDEEDNAFWDIAMYGKWEEEVLLSRSLNDWVKLLWNIDLKNNKRPKERCLRVFLFPPPKVLCPTTKSRDIWFLQCIYFYFSSTWINLRRLWMMLAWAICGIRRSGGGEDEKGRRRRRNDDDDDDDDDDDVRKLHLITTIYSLDVITQEVSSKFPSVNKHVG